MLAKKVFTTVKGIYKLKKDVKKVKLGIKAISKYGLSSMGIGKVTMTGEMQLILKRINKTGKYTKGLVSLTPQMAKMSLRASGVMSAVGVVTDIFEIVNIINTFNEPHAMSVKLQEVLN